MSELSTVAKQIRQHAIEQAAAAFGQQAPIKVVQIIHDPSVKKSPDAGFLTHSATCSDRTVLSAEPILGTNVLRGVFTP